MTTMFYIKETEQSLYYTLKNEYNLMVDETHDTYRFSLRSSYVGFDGISKIMVKKDEGILISKYSHPRPQTPYPLARLMSALTIPFNTINFYEVVEDVE